MLSAIFNYRDKTGRRPYENVSAPSRSWPASACLEVELSAYRKSCSVIGEAIDRDRIPRIVVEVVDPEGRHHSEGTSQRHTVLGAPPECGFPTRYRMRRDRHRGRK